MTDADEREFVAFLRSTGDIQLLESFAPAPELMAVTELAPRGEGHWQYFIWNRAFAWKPEHARVAKGAVVPDRVGWPGAGVRGPPNEGMKLSPVADKAHDGRVWRSEEPRGTMKTASWALLALAGVATLVISLVSAARAYGTYNDHIGGARLSELSAGRPELETAVRARRATAAAYGAGFATLFLLISVGPYRRGDVWAWWALLVGMLVVAVLILLRIPLLGTGLGGSVGGGTATGSLTQLLIVGVGLALDAGRLRQRRPGDSA